MRSARSGPSTRRQVPEQRRDERLRVPGFDELGGVDDDPVRAGEHLRFAHVARAAEVALDIGRRAVGGHDVAAQRRVTPARLERARWGRRNAELDDRTVGLVQQPACGSGLVDDADDAVGGRLVSGVGAVVRVEGVDVVGTEQFVARDVERDGFRGGLGRVGRRGGGRFGGGGRSARIGRPGHDPGASGEQENGCRGDERGAEGGGSGGVERARHVTNLINRAG